MFPVPDSANLRVIGSRWVCVACDVGITSPHKPICWICGVADEMVAAHQYPPPTSASFLHPMLNHVEEITT